MSERTSTTWRDLITIHPAADLFPLMEGAEFDELVTDIKKHGGIKVPLVFWKDPASGERFLLDGRNRLNAAEIALGPVVLGDHDCPTVGDAKLLARIEAGDPNEIVISLNVRRRHLTGEKRQELIKKLLKASPEKSDRQIAATVKASPTTVGTVRAGLEQSGDVSKLDTHTDTKGRKQPAIKAAKTPKAKPPQQSSRSKTLIDFAAELHADLAQTLDALTQLLSDERTNIIGLISNQKRVVLARGYLTALGVTLDDLQPIGG